MTSRPWIGLVFSLAFHGAVFGLVFLAVWREETLPELVVDLRESFAPKVASVRTLVREALPARGSAKAAPPPAAKLGRGEAAPVSPEPAPAAAPSPPAPSAPPPPVVAPPRAIPEPPPVAAGPAAPEPAPSPPAAQPIPEPPPSPPLPVILPRTPAPVPVVVPQPPMVPAGPMPGAPGRLSRETVLLPAPAPHDRGEGKAVPNVSLAPSTGSTDAVSASPATVVSGGGAPATSPATVVSGGAAPAASAADGKSGAGPASTPGASRGVTGAAATGSEPAPPGRREASGPVVVSLAGSGGSGVGAEYGAYLTALRTRIQQALRYPHTARRRGLSGTVSVEILIQPNGTIGNVTLLDSSSHSSLDDAALETIRALPRMPMPPELPARPIRVRIPVVFEMR